MEFSWQLQLSLSHLLMCEKTNVRISSVCDTSRCAMDEQLIVVSSAVIWQVYSRQDGGHGIINPTY